MIRQRRPTRSVIETRPANENAIKPLRQMLLLSNARAVDSVRLVVLSCESPNIKAFGQYCISDSKQLNPVGLSALWAQCAETLVQRRVAHIAEPLIGANGGRIILLDVERHQIHA